MSPRRGPDERGPFLGTEQIIKRLREARTPAWRHQARTTFLTYAFASALLVACAVVFHRVASFRRQPGAPEVQVAAAPPPVEPEVASHVGQPSLEASYDAPLRPHKSLKRRAATARPPAAPQRPAAPVDEGDGADTGQADALWNVDEGGAAASLPAADDPATSGRVRIEIDGPPGTIFVDGKRVALDTRWDVDLSHGDHYLMVRLGGRSMTYRLRLRGAGVKVVFDDQASAIREETWQPRAKDL